MPRGSGDRLAARVVYTGPLRAPLKKGAQVARLQVMRGDIQALDVPLYAGEDVAVGTITQRAWDGLLEFGTGWVLRAFSNVTNRG
jgi:D-alanyl-D-alanine carboxypeptidase (penicillin-binding protein 5/6)